MDFHVKETTSNKYDFPQPSPPSQWNAPIVAPTGQFRNPPVPQQWNNQEPAIILPTDHTQASREIFLRCKPLVLGIVVILMSIIHLALGIGLIFIVPSIPHHQSTGAPIWGGSTFIIAGSLTIAASKKFSMCLIRSTLVSNIINLILAIVAFILDLYEMADLHCYTVTGYRYNKCVSHLAAVYVIGAVFIVTYLVQFASAITICVYARRALRYFKLIGSHEVVVIQNQTAGPTPSATDSGPYYPPMEKPDVNISS